MSLYTKPTVLASLEVETTDSAHLIGSTQNNNCSDLLDSAILEAAIQGSARLPNQSGFAVVDDIQSTSSM